MDDKTIDDEIRTGRASKKYKKMFEKQKPSTIEQTNGRTDTLGCSLREIIDNNKKGKQCGIKSLKGLIIKDTHKKRIRSCSNHVIGVHSQ